MYIQKLHITKVRFFVLFFSLITVASFGQKEDAMRPTQWWLGLKAGINSTQVNEMESYSVFSESIQQPVTYENESQKYGYHIGMVGTFDFLRYMSLSFQPTAKMYRFGYNYGLEWRDSTGTDSYTSNYEHDQSLTYIDFPLFFRFEYRRVQHGEKKGTNSRNLPKHAHSKGHHHNPGAIVPYVQVGLYYSTLISANKSIDYLTNDNGVESSARTERIGIRDTYLNTNYGFMFGGGVAYDFKSMRVAVDANYRIGSHNITSHERRYAHEQLVTEYYDVPNDLSLNNLEVQFYILFPMKFIVSGNFTSF